MAMMLMVVMIRDEDDDKAETEDEHMSYIMVMITTTLMLKRYIMLVNITNCLHPSERCAKLVLVATSIGLLCGIGMKHSNSMRQQCHCTPDRTTPFPQSI